MKCWLHVVMSMVVGVCSAQPSENEIVSARANSNAPLLAHVDSVYPRQAFIADLRDHSIDVFIAGLYLLGSGFPGMSDKISWEANALASALWITDSVVRIVAVCRKRSEVKRA